MANLADRLADNAPGKYYVDSSCIDCDQCRETAPHLFSRNADSGHSFVLAQPGNDDDTGKISQILADCPVQAIGDDGS